MEKPHQKRPFAKLTKPIECPTVAEVDAILTFVRSYGTLRTRRRDYLALTFMADCGLRLSELLAIRLEDVTYDNSIKEALTIRAEDAKYGSGRTIPMTDRVKTAISDLIHDKFYRCSWLHQFIFYSHPEKIQALSPRLIQMMLAGYSIAAIKRRLHPHQLRHYFATELMRVTNQRVVQQALGHRSLSTTSIYSHPDMNDMKKAIAKLGK